MWSLALCLGPRLESCGILTPGDSRRFIDLLDSVYGDQGTKKIIETELKIPVEAMKIAYVERTTRHEGRGPTLIE
jgi:hypothetical protein